MRMVRHWNRLPRDVVDAPYWEEFGARLDGSPRHLISDVVESIPACGGNGTR